MTDKSIQENAYYEPGANRANRVRDLFDRIARRYDLINDVQSAGLHRWWKKRVITEAGQLEDTKALDICCGTGDLAFALAARGAQTTGFDFSSEMLFQAREKAQAKQTNDSAALPNFQQGDATKLPFETDTFDVVTMAYGLRNLKDWKLGLSELHRVTRPGGRMLILDFGKPPNPLWRSVYYNYLKLIVPVMGWSLAGDAEAYRYILTSLQHFPAQRGIEAEMIRLNSRHVRTHLFIGGVMSLNIGTK
jgi:demethylmenaquinone methyltransferase/2-methoxy-6-polyprenyl-1,4-benzoquinol methylase